MEDFSNRSELGGLRHPTPSYKHNGINWVPKKGADCDSDHELFITKFRLKLKKVGKTTRPLSYDLNQIPYNYTVEVTKRLKGFYLIDRVHEEYGWRFVTLYRRQ